MKEKKIYEAPEMKVYQVQKANIIATSTQTFNFDGEQGFTQEEW